MRLTRVIVSVRCGCGKYRPVRLLLPLWFGLLVCVVYSSSIARLGWRSESGFISFQSSSVVPSSACRPQLRQSAIVAAAGCDVIKSDSIPSDIHFISFTHHFFFLLFFCNFCFRLIFCWYLNLIRWWSDEPISPGSDQDRIRIGPGSDQGSEQERNGSRQLDGNWIWIEWNAMDECGECEDAESTYIQSTCSEIQSMIGALIWLKWRLLLLLQRVKQPIKRISETNQTKADRAAQIEPTRRLGGCLEFENELKEFVDRLPIAAAVTLPFAHTTEIVRIIQKTGCHRRINGEVFNTIAVGGSWVDCSRHQRVANMGPESWAWPCAARRPMRR